MVNKLNKAFMSKAILVLVIAALLQGCSEKENIEFTDWAIIESYIHPGDYFNVKITRQIPFSEGVTYSSDDINNLSIVVKHNNQDYLLEPLGDGKYADSSLMVEEGDEYELTFYFNSEKVYAYTYIPSKPKNFTQSVTEISITRMDSNFTPGSGGFEMPDPVELTWVNTNNDYYLAIVENMETTLDPIRDFGDATPPGNFFRKQPTNSSGTELRAMEFQYFGTHRIILYHVLPDYAALYNNSTSSSQNLTNPSTSISNGYGIFTGLNADTLYIEVKEK